MVYLAAQVESRILAQFVVTHRQADLPASVKQEATRSLLNWVGCAVGGSRHDTVERALMALGPFSGPRAATVLGRAEKLDIMLAALMNGITSHTFDFDDTHLRTVIHPSGPVASAIQALAETRPVTGAEFLHAFVLGVEVSCRIGNAVYPSHYDVGWHITGTTGVFGAAAAAGRLLGLDEQQMVWALGIAATQASGLREMFGTMCKPFHPGNAARNGLLSALLAQKNFTSSNQAIEAPRGFANVLSKKFDPKVITEGLGSRFELLSNMYKPYACGLVVHAAIDGCIEIARENKLAPDAIAAIELTVSPLVPRLTGKPEPQTGLEGKFSVYHAVSAAIVHGAAGEAQFSDACVRDPRVIAVRKRVTLTEDAAIGRTEAKVTIRARDGRTFSKHVEHALGTLQRPMSDADLEAKFRALAQDLLPAAQVDNIIKLCWQIAASDDAGTVPRAAAARN
jgi:2-methylcitrate dehydratase PrpD